MPTITHPHSLLLDTLSGKPGSRPPFWFMRQAGRVLPRYMDLRNKYSFWQLMQDSELASKVTLLPVEDLGVDAAILFSDILVIPYAMGMGLEFTDHGPVFEKALSQYDKPLEALHPDASKLDYIYLAIDKIVKDKPTGIPLIGFCGAPFTVLCYMIQGLSKKADFPDAIQFIYKNRTETKKMIDAITDLSIEYALKQIEHGVEVFQLFETHAGLLPSDLYQLLFFPAIERIGRAVMEKNIPFIYFPKGLGTGIEKITPDMCNYVGIDWQMPLSKARELVIPELGLQGNIDPRLLYAPKEEIIKVLETYRNFGKKNHNWIVNLGHGFLPDTPFESAIFLSEWIRNADWER